MARQGYYSVSTAEHRWEICRSNMKRQCWGVNISLNNRETLNTRAPSCTGLIEPGQIYLRHPDPREERRAPTPYDWPVCMWCAAKYHADKLTGDLTSWQPLSPADIQDAKLKTEKMLEELNNMAIGA